MTPERQRQIEDVYRAVRERPSGEWSVFLAGACGSNSELRSEVEARLAADGVRPGSQLGPYRIGESIGKGGMGEVWKARDTRLQRDVAVKFSAQRFSGRFEREARAIAALNHPNICTLYDVGPNYLVMELVDGPTLADRIARGPIPVEEAISIAKQMTLALEVAHEKGIVHRDLKPANIKVRPDGSVKILDFGLAKANDAGETNDEAPTITLTKQGTVIGTPGYMAPEQVRGETVDKRADIWAFGAVLFEMVTAHRAFEGRSVSDTLAAVIKDEPDWRKSPARLRRMLRACLEKDPKLRLRDIGDAWQLLDDATVHVDVRSRSRLSLVGGIAAGVMAIAAATIAFIHYREPQVELPLTRLAIPLPDKTHAASVGWTPPAVSPDGRKVVFEILSDSGKLQYWLRPLDSMAAQPIAGTEGGSYAFWSPDSKSIAFFANGKLKRLDVSGGPATEVADAALPRGGTWNQNGVIVFAPTPYSGLIQVPASGGQARQATSANPKSATRFPCFLPDGHHFIYMAGTSGSDYTIHVASLDSPADDHALPGTVDSFAVYAQGHLLFAKGDALMARPFDAKSFAFTGEAVPAAGHLKMGGSSVTGMASFSASEGGTLVYQSDAPLVHLTWLDRSGKVLSQLGEPENLSNLRLSPDDRTAGVVSGETANSRPGIWLYDLVRGLHTRLSSEPSTQNSPIWSPDGKTVLFRSNRLGRLNFYRIPADGSRTEELVYADNLVKNTGSFSPDGKLLAYTSFDAKSGFDISILPGPLEKQPGKPYPFLQSEFNEQSPEFSPDGHWIAYMSNQSGRNEIYVSAFPGPGARTRISTGGGTGQRWRRDGKELFYASPDGHMMAAEVEAKGGALEVTKVEALFGPVTRGFDVSSDGKRFLVLAQEESESVRPFVVVQNWTAGLRK